MAAVAGRRSKSREIRGAIDVSKLEDWFDADRLDAGRPPAKRSILLARQMILQRRSKRAGPDPKNGCIRHIGGPPGGDQFFHQSGRHDRHIATNRENPIMAVDRSMMQGPTKAAKRPEVGARPIGDTRQAVCSLNASADDDPGDVRPNCARGVREKRLAGQQRQRFVTAET